MFADACHEEAGRRLEQIGLAARRLPLVSAPFPIWLIRTPDDIPAALTELLSINEKDRASHFLLPHLYRRYVGAHGAMRLLCETYFQITARNQHFAYGCANKPYLAGIGDAQCNLSYSGNFAIIGVSQGNPIGVDLERRRSLEDADELSNLHYSEAERRAMNRAGRLGHDRDSAFLRIWVKKEACLKAIGCGLTLPLNEISCGMRSRGAPVRFGKQQIRTGVLHICDRFDFSSPCDLLVGWAQLD